MPHAHKSHPPPPRPLWLTVVRLGAAVASTASRSRCVLTMRTVRSPASSSVGALGLLPRATARARSLAAWSTGKACDTGDTHRRDQCEEQASRREATRLVGTWIVPAFVSWQALGVTLG
jgi:hypothetical protein